MPDGDTARVWSRPHVQTFIWLLGAVGIVSAGYAFVAYRNRGFFLVDDTESAILPMMAHLGDELRRGVWPAISERNWTVGLVAGDPQYSTFNPFSLFVYWAGRAAAEPRVADLRRRAGVRQPADGWSLLVRQSPWCDRAVRRVGGRHRRTQRVHPLLAGRRMGDLAARRRLVRRRHRRPHRRARSS